MRGTGQMAAYMRRLRALLAVAAAYALVLQPLSMAGALARAMAAQPLHGGVLGLCSASATAGAASSDVTSPVDRPVDLPVDRSDGAAHGACCCLAAAGGAPWTPVTPVVGLANIEFSTISGTVMAAAAQAPAAISHPSARPRAPPAVWIHHASVAGSRLGTA